MADARRSDVEYDVITWRSCEHFFSLITVPFWAITQRVVVNSYRRFGTTYRSHLQESTGVIVELYKPKYMRSVWSSLLQHTESGEAAIVRYSLQTIHTCQTAVATSVIYGWPPSRVLLTALVHTASCSMTCIRRDACVIATVDTRCIDLAY